MLTLIKKMRPKGPKKAAFLQPFWSLFAAFLGVKLNPWGPSELIKSGPRGLKSDLIETNFKTYLHFYVLSPAK